MTIVVSLIVVFFAWAAFRGWLRGSVQNHDERARSALKATIDSLDAGQNQKPSWANDPGKMHAFTYAVRKLIDRAGISEETRTALFAEEETQKYLLTHAAHMEHKRASFIQQQLGAGELATQMAQAFDRRKASGIPFELTADKEAVGKEAEIDEALRQPIRFFVEMYDQLERERRRRYALAVYIIYEMLVDMFGSLDGFIESSDDVQLKFVVNLKPTDEDSKRHTQDVAFVYKLSRQFVSAVLLLMREERDVFFDEAAPQPSPALSLGIKRLVEIAEEGKAEENGERGAGASRPVAELE